MNHPRKTTSIRSKMYLFTAITVLIVAVAVGLVTFLTSANQIDLYYQNNTSDNARNLASMVDAEFLKQLKAVAASEEYQNIRDMAEEAEDETPVIEYLQDQGLWEDYEKTRDIIDNYLLNMEHVSYLYLVAPGDANAQYDMYLVDDRNEPVYSTGYYEEREQEFQGVDIVNLPQPTISHGDWGWLCSDFKPVYDDDGKVVCIAGCDINMDDVMNARERLIIMLITGAFIVVALVVLIAVLFLRRTIVNPLKDITEDMKKFTPEEYENYEQAGVLSVSDHRTDEIGELRNGIRTMQMDIVDYLKHNMQLREDKDRAEHALNDKDKEIERLEVESYKDALTGVGNKAAYIRQIAEINERMASGFRDFAMVMIDMNNLKYINDQFGHKAGDLYIQGCCSMIVEMFQETSVFRIGGDEFIVILQNEDYTLRFPKVTRLKENYNLTYSNTNQKEWFRYSAAVGLAEAAYGDTTAELVFKRADKAMYENKAKFKEKHPRN